MTKFIARLALLFALPFAAYAQQALEVNRGVGIDAPIDKVWELMGNFTDMSWNPLIVKTELVAGEATIPGAMRVLTLNDGSQIKQALVSFDPEEKVYTYKITESVLPMRQHQGKISTMSKDGITMVNWEATYTTDSEADAEVVSQTMQALFEKGLEGLKIKAEQ